MAPACVYIWLCVNICVSKGGESKAKKIVPTRMMASNTKGRIYGTTVCAQSNKATRQKEGVKKLFTRCYWHSTLHG